MRCIATYYTVLLSFTNDTITAQTPTFRTIGVKQGLSHHDVLAFHKDRYGAIWLGTAEGLDRYDGERIINLGPEHGLPSPIVQHIAANEQGILSLATYNGLASVDPATCKIETLDGVQNVMQCATIAW